MRARTTTSSARSGGTWLSARVTSVCRSQTLWGRPAPGVLDEAAGAQERVLDAEQRLLVPRVGPRGEPAQEELQVRGGRRQGIPDLVAQLAQFGRVLGLGHVSTSWRRLS